MATWIYCPTEHDWVEEGFCEMTYCDMCDTLEWAEDEE